MKGTLLQRYRRPLCIGAALLIVMVVGSVDYLTGYEISFSVFYVVALWLASWYVGLAFALFISALSVTVSLAGDLATGGTGLVPWWNATILLSFYLVVVWLLTRLRRAQSDLERRVRERTAALSAEMAERARLERELIEISEREQRRIGYDLHDSVCQHLTATALAGQVLEEKLAARGLAEARDAGTVVGMVEESIALSRKLARGLDPLGDDAEGLMHGLEELATATTELFKINCTFECDSPVLIHDATAAGHLYRIAQEAISNAVKHGRAKNIVIRLETDDAGSVLHVEDDGIGLPDPVPATGMGMRIMRHRAGMIGADLEVRQHHAGGTWLTCRLRNLSETPPA